MSKKHSARITYRARNLQPDISDWSIIITISGTKIERAIIKATSRKQNTKLIWSS